MPGYRKTHDFPGGKPLPLRLLGVADVVFFLVLVFLAGRGWPHAVAIIAIILLVAFAHLKLLRHYEEIGRAVPIPQALKFPNGIPGPLRALRYSFFVIVAVMLALGVTPIPDRIARNGIIAAVFALFAVGIAHALLEYRYVSLARESELEARLRAIKPDQAAGSE